MNVKLFHYFSALLVLLGCASLYRGLSMHLLRPPKVDVVDPRPPTDTPQLRADLADLFPEGSWQLGDCKRILTSNGVLLFQNWEPTTEKHWNLEPITIVVGRGLSDAPAAAPVVLTADKGGEIEFADSFDVTGGNVPAINVGRMIGKVKISRRSPQDPASNFELTTSSVYIDNQKVWTTERIQMNFGRASLLGRDLTIHLTASAVNATHADSPSSVLDRMELIYLDDFHVPLDPPERDSPARRNKPRNNPFLGGELTLNCDGKLSYDFARNRLHLRDQVNLVRKVAGTNVDDFRCEHLELVLREPHNDQLIRKSLTDWVHTLRASGMPASVNVAEYDLSVIAEEIDLDAIGGLLTATGRRGIQVVKGPIRARLAELTYQFDPQNPKTYGSVDVLGPGIITITDPKLPLQKFQWNKSFLLQPIATDAADASIDDPALAASPSPIDSRFQFRVDGQVRADLLEGGSFAAHTIEGTFHSFAVPNRDAAVAKLPTEPGASESAKKKLSFFPEVVEARGDVELVSDSGNAATQQLRLYFKRTADWLANWDAREDSSQRSASTVSQVVSQPNAPTTKTIRHPVSKPRPAVAGKQIVAQVLLSSEGHEVSDLSVKGNVTIRHQLETKRTLLPVEISGDSVRLVRGGITQGNGQDRLQLRGLPGQHARLDIGDGHFSGPAINVWPGEDLVRVDGAGEFKVPSKLLAAAKKSGEDKLNRVQWIQPPLCRWDGGFEFRRQQARMNGGVTIDATLMNEQDPWAATMSGDEMTISLTEPVSLSEENLEDQASIKRIELVQQSSQPVTIQANQFAADQAPQAKHLITANRLVMDPRGGGSIVGVGPGWYRGWILSNENDSLLPLPANQNAAPSSTQPGKEVLQGVHLTYRESVAADIANRTIQFGGGVRAGLRELEHWQQSVDVSQMDRLAVGESTLDCMTLQFGVSPDAPKDLLAIPGYPTPWEMRASGGVIIRSQQERMLYEMTSNHANYSSRKSLLIVKGAPNKNAVMKLTDSQGRVVLNTPFPEFSFNPKTFEAEMRMERAVIGNLPGKLRN